MENKDSKTRTANFSAMEKQLLFSLVHKYKNIVENKKTDATTNNEKNKAWQEIEREFNSNCPDERHRSAQTLKKCFNNKKKEIRKAVAEENKERYLTGGGTAAVTMLDVCPDKDLLLSIMSNKTTYGLKNKFDSDQLEYDESNLEIIVDEIHDNTTSVQGPSSSEGLPSKRLRIDSVSTSNDDGSSISLGRNNLQTLNWGHPKASMLMTPVSSVLKNATHEATPKATPASSRRRPAVVVKALTSSAVAEKYNCLLDKRLAIAEMELKQQKFTEERNLKRAIWEDEQQALQRQALLLDIEIKKKKLND